MDSLLNILNKKDFSPPDEIQLIKDYIYKEYRVEVTVAIRNNDIIIDTPSAALANTLRLRSPDLKAVANTTKRLVFNISG